MLMLMQTIQKSGYLWGNKLTAFWESGLTVQFVTHLLFCRHNRIPRPATY